MLDIIMWILISALFILSFVGVIFPIVPSVLVIWIGFLIYHFVINANELTMSFWIAMSIITVILIVADVIANGYFVKKYGGSKWGERGAAIAVIVGSFIIPPFGILIVPFLTVFIIELMQQRTVQEALLASFGSLVGFLGGTIAKVIIQLFMIIWFFVAILF
ncbi:MULTISPECIES: DUF456 domain-containing protein [Virgibacillus]|uniref:DUF456 family protein n=2 Tax=Virgibacillus TaxID=84406 RepID=A0A024QFN8_9BACI|nr:MULTISPECIES: DUF456 domain-containing protein [Virgibacillus]EQB38864.1 membrane protein [Virgibacillus sp. CM-4]MYL43231.1 DUF456 family protein [Virgibacillus massiliensis]GGJ66604.1 membrane protein [Virgibacillus kapii]CDQ40990.1 hypothetical protein BN990_03340 [Virgibacillus massiliensis]